MQPRRLAADFQFVALIVGRSCAKSSSVTFGPNFSGPVCVPTARPKNHTLFGSTGSTWKND